MVTDTITKTAQKQLDAKKMAQLQQRCTQAAQTECAHWDHSTKQAIIETVQLLDQGLLRVMQPTASGWQHHSWLQQAIVLYLRMQPMIIQQHDFNAYKDKVMSKFYNPQTLAEHPGRVVPPAHVRFGAYIGKDTVLMPCFINIGAYVDAGCMIDTWATVGSGAQIGKAVHISGGAGIGGVLEPIQAKPTIIEDGCFIGARSEIVEGVIVRRGAVISMGVFIGQSTKIYERSSGKVYYGEVPENAVVVPGSLPVADGSHSLACAVIVKYADAKTRAKTSINELLRDC